MSPYISYKLPTTSKSINLNEKYNYDYTHPQPQRRKMDWASRWIWVLLATILLFMTTCLYGFENIKVPVYGGYVADVIQTFRGSRVRIQTLHPRFLPETGKHRKSGRLIVVGDVHGMKTQLEALLAKVDFNPQEDHLILTGDMIDKGPDSAGVIDLAMDLGASCVMGNHEHKAIAAQSDWLLAMGNRRVRWIKDCPHILKVGKLGKMGEVVVVHAGLEPGKALKKQSAKHVMNMRIIDHKGVPSSRKDGVDWFKRWNQHQKTLKESKRTTVIYGHNSGLGLQGHKYTKGLDTGCVNGGMLTAMVIEGGHSHHITKYTMAECPNARA